jgi:5-carboxymethyl-2-hydroxymuconate isomerase
MGSEENEMKIQALSKALVCGIIVVLLCANSVPVANGIDAIKDGTLSYHGSLSGHVVDEGMNPVQGVRVRVSFHDTYRESDTNATGYYRVTDVPVCADAKNVSCTKLGYYPMYTLMNINGSTTHDFVLTSMPIYPELPPPDKSGWYTSNVVITFHITGPVNHTYYAFNEDPWTEYTAPITVSQDGIYVLHWQCPDEQGTPSVYWVGLNIDRTAPIFQWLGVTALNFRKTCYLMNATVFEPTSGVAKIEFYVDDILVGNVMREPYEFLYQGTGRYAQAIAYDNAGNSRMSWPPPLMHQSPGIHQDASRALPSQLQQTSTTLFHGVLSGHVIDSGMYPVQGARVRVSFHDTYRDGYTDAAGLYTVADIPVCPCMKNVSCFANGYYTAYSTMEINASSFHDFVLGSMPVYWTYGGTMGENGWYTSTVFFTLVFHNISHVYYALDEDAWSEYTSPFGVSANGNHTFHWFWVDEQKDSSPVFWVTFKIDHTSPIVIDFLGMRLGLQLWKLSATASDNTSGLQRVDFYVDNTLVGSFTGSPYEMAWKGPMWLIWLKHLGNPSYLPQCIVYDNAGNSAMLGS